MAASGVILLAHCAVIMAAIASYVFVFTFVLVKVADAKQA